MRVSLFGLFPQRTSLMESWPKLVWLVSLIFGFIQFYWLFISLGDIWGCPICFTSYLFTCSYLIIPCIFSSRYYLLYLFCCYCMLVLTTLFSMHIYDSYLSKHVCYLCTPLGIGIITRWGVLTPLDPYVQILELRAGGFTLLIRVAQQKCSGSVEV